MEIAKTKSPDELFTWEDIEKMKYSLNVARESLTLTPPAQGAFRETITELTYAGFTIPKTFGTVHSSHKNPKYFPEPEKFDPSGSIHVHLEVLMFFMHTVVTRFKLEKAIPNENIVFHAFPTLLYGLLVRSPPAS
ncbi:hypothetical protein Pfo_017316 [Paulownia fortunei]|nr:hypothetical protein Pfo_017316 [Paulownia fortunei]